MSDDDFDNDLERARLQGDLKQAFEQLSIVQTRCTQLLEERRALSAVVGGTDAEAHALAELVRERRRQDAKWGPIDAKMIAIPDGTGAKWSGEAWAHRLEEKEAFQTGRGTWRHVLREEIYEAFAESDPAKLRSELVQAGAVIVKWLEILERRASACEMCGETP
jgi:hypothetical protein